MDNALYLFIHKLGPGGDLHIQVKGTTIGIRTFTGVYGKVKSIHWSDNGDELSFKQNRDQLEVDFTGYPCAVNLVVRCAVCEME